MGVFAVRAAFRYRLNTPSWLVADRLDWSTAKHLASEVARLHTHLSTFVVETEVVH